MEYNQNTNASCILDIKICALINFNISKHKAAIAYSTYQNNSIISILASLMRCAVPSSYVSISIATYFNFTSALAGGEKYD